jgi:hypothetical protein
MIFPTLLALITALLPALLSADFVAPTNFDLVPVPKSANPQSNGFMEKAANALPTTVTLIPDVGFYQFNFGPDNTDVPVKFVFTNKVVQVLTLVDCFWNMDSFKMKNFGRDIGNASGGCVFTDATCSHYRDDPYGCWKLDGIFCTITAVILPGTNSITISSLSSSLGGGSAFIRLDTGCSDGASVVPCCDIPVNERLCNISIFHDASY